MFTAGNIILIVLTVISALFMIYFWKTSEGLKPLRWFLAFMFGVVILSENIKETKELNAVPDRYEKLLSKVESEDNLLLDTVQEVPDWNTEVTEGREKEQKLIHKIFLPTVYDKVDTIDMKIENIKYVK